ncbi:MAG: hypothetical protein S4CHLAM123_03170 [Chlamydiales bacterium]|nr:hypothetical protein [Chlamydiales bacterium]
MKKIITLLILGMICIPCLGAQLEKNKGFGYGSLGSIGGYPTLGGGYRMQYEYQGFDISGKCTPWIPATTAAEIRGLYLLYPMQKGIYLGTGCGYLWAIESLPRGSVTFDAVVGYQWETAKGRKLFCQVEAITAVKESCCDRTTPAITFGIGF